MLGAPTQRTEMTTYAATLASSRRRLPWRSLIGPANSWPIASPSRQAVSDSCTADDDASRSSAMRGSAGR